MMLSNEQVSLIGRTPHSTGLQFLCEAVVPKATTLTVAAVVVWFQIVRKRTDKLKDLQTNY